MFIKVITPIQLSQLSPERGSKPPISLQVMLAYKSTLYNITMTLKSCFCYYYCLDKRRQLKVVDRRVEVLCGVFFFSFTAVVKKA